MPRAARDAEDDHTDRADREQQSRRIATCGLRKAAYAGRRRASHKGCVKPSLSHIPDQSNPWREVIGGSERDEGIVAQPSGVDEPGNEPCRATSQDCDMQPSIGVTVECWGKGAVGLS
mgnify:CR=1 FL=1